MYPVAIGFLGIPIWSPGGAERVPPPYRYAASVTGVTFSGLEGEDHVYEIVPLNILSEEGLPSQKLTVRCPSRPNLRLYWLAVPGAVQYKIIRDRFLIATVGAVEARDSNYRPPVLSFYDRGEEDIEEYTPVSWPCQLYLPFQTTSKESWSPPSQD